ncbi:MAG: DUF1850 domain-containing protein [Alphaproteobacteria bacterium]
MNLCLIAGAKTTILAASAFTLSWTHSVEKTGWEEDWRLTPAGMVAVEARIQGSGAGMEPPPDAVLRDGWWRYRPSLPPQPRLLLARSGAAGSWRLCTDAECLSLDGKNTDRGPVEIQPCE